MEKVNVHHEMGTKYDLKVISPVYFTKGSTVSELLARPPEVIQALLLPQSFRMS